MATLTRRALLASLGAATLPLGLPRPAVGAGRQAAAPRPVIRTLTGDVPPNQLSGAVLFHEHLSMRFPLDATAHFTDDVALMTEEARAAKADGLAFSSTADIPTCTAASTRCTRISKDSGLPVVASGGYYMQRSYPAELAGKSAEQIADAWCAEAARDRLGAFGEIGQERGTLTEPSRPCSAPSASRRRAPDCRSSRTTPTSASGRAPPTSRRDAALRQLDMLEQSGADLDHLAIGHLCCLHDPKADGGRSPSPGAARSSASIASRWRSFPTPTRSWRQWHSSRPGTPTSCCCPPTSPRRDR